MTTPNDAELICPQCGHANPAKADYCWECRFDFIRDDRVKAKVAARPAPPPKPIPPPYSRKPQEEAVAHAGPKVSLVVYLVELVLSVLIVGGSWKLLAMAVPTMTIVPFLLGWVAALGLVWFSEGRLPDVEMDFSKYWSLNPFNFQDDINRKVLDWHIMLFLPRIVLRTIRHSLMVFRAAPATARS